MSDFKSDFEVICSLGEPALLEQLAEECSELAHAALKMARLERGENPTPKAKIDCESALMEEIADVHLCLGVISSHFECYNKLDDIEISKRERWVQRIREARGETQEKKKTRQSEFLKILPNVGLEEGVINICPERVSGENICVSKESCMECKKDFWLAEVK
uniref:NTP-PPase-like protein n=1 Tax=Myoviridae sp. ctuev19 TaxID=2827716 RepID=A0A8S5SF09_9CAUD|nr:MAG TPA: NTP-PPase-like protein [Myoviridae sp. ctuev19]